MLTTAELYDFGHTLAGEYLSRYTYPWEALKGIKDFILALGETLDKGEYTEISPSVWVHKTVKIAPTAYLGAPCIIGAGTEVRHCAFIRGSALVGENCVVGNSVELKNVILFDNVQTPHYNYVGDSILGYKSHMGAGSITSNVKSDKTPVTVKNGTEIIETVKTSAPITKLYSEIVTCNFTNFMTDYGEIVNEAITPDFLGGAEYYIPASIRKEYSAYDSETHTCKITVEYTYNTLFGITNNYDESIIFKALDHSSLN